MAVSPELEKQLELEKLCAQYKDEAAYHQKKVEERDRRIEALRCEKTTIEMELTDRAIERDVELGGLVSEDDKAANAPLALRVDLALRAAVRTLALSPLWRRGFVIYLAVMHLWCFLLFVWSMEAKPQ